MDFLEKYGRARKSKNSVLCAGLDPASCYMRGNGIRKEYFEDSTEVEGIMQFCLDIVKAVSKHCCAIKANMQYVMPLSLEQYKKLNSAAHSAGLVSILDNKLGDIGSSNAASVYWAAQAGFDALTFSPFAGNIEEATKTAHEKNIGLIALTLMSNPQAKHFMRDNSIRGKKGYQWIADEIGRCGTDGAVVGATNTDASEIAYVRKAIGDDKVILIPGVGAQGGDLKGTRKAFGDNILVNVGRSILYASSPAKAAQEYNEMLNGL